jgi:endonuclease/exonuclease/phosphatase family metal-dependent hydrolase
MNLSLNLSGNQPYPQPRTKPAGLSKTGLSHAQNSQKAGSIVRFPIQFAGAGQLRVMSYNAENFFDNVDDPKTKVNDVQWAKSEKSVKALAEAILKENPDIIAFQEIENDTVLKDLNTEHLNGQYPGVVVYPTNDDRGIRVAYLYKSDVKLLDSKSHRGEMENGIPVFSRDLLEATFETENGNKITLFNSHFKAMRGGEAETTPRRVSQAKRSKQIIDAKIKANPDIKIAFVGDLNTLHTSHGQKVLDILNGKNNPDPKFKLVEMLEKDGKIPMTHEGGKKFPDSKLDYCYVTPNLAQVSTARVSGKIGQNPWKTASDHLPVVLDVQDPAKNQVASTSQNNPIQFGHSQTAKHLVGQTLQQYA